MSYYKTMFKKALIFIIVLNFLASCGYTPIYSSNKMIKFNINKLDLKGDWELNNFIRNSIKKYSSDNESKTFQIMINTNYFQKSITKDSSGNTTNFEFTIEAEVDVSFEDKNKKYFFKESFVMQNFSNELDKSNYERSNKNNIANIIIDKLMMQLSRLE